MRSFRTTFNRSLLLIALTVGLRLICVDAPTILAQGSGDDFDPAKVDGNWWAANGVYAYVPGAYMDNNVVRFTFNPIMYYTAHSKLINGHVTTSSGTGILHLHYERPLDAVERSQTDRWFDCLFGASETPPRTTRVADADVAKNCHAHAFGTLGRGTYNYWAYGDGIYDDAVGDECNPVAKAAVKTGDLLMYSVADASNSHTTVVHAASNYTTTKLRWKGGYSGIYECSVAGSFDTPRYDASSQSTTPGAAVVVANWTWGSNLMGDGSTLWSGPTKDNTKDMGKYVQRKK